MWSNKKFKWTITKKKALVGFICVLPWCIGYLAFSLIPNLTSLYMSFNEWDFFSEPYWVGIDNYLTLFQDPVFILSLRNTVLIMVFSNIINILFGLLLAVILAKNPPGHYLMRTVLYLPSLVMPVAMGMMFRQIYSSGTYGLLNQFIGLFGFSPQHWLTQPNLAVWAVIIGAFWSVGGSMIIFLAGLKGINPEYYEAAMIDGAGPFYRFFYITLPLLTPVIVFQIIMGLIGSGGLQVFEFPATLAGFSGAANSMGYYNSLGTLVFYLYMQGFRYLQFGMASAIAWVVFGIALILGVFIYRLSQKYDFYGINY